MRLASSAEEARRCSGKDNSNGRSFAHGPIAKLTLRTSVTAN